MADCWVAKPGSSNGLATRGVSAQNPTPIIDQIVTCQPQLIEAVNNISTNPGAVTTIVNSVADSIQTVIENHPAEVTALINSIPTLIANNPAAVTAVLNSLPILIPKINQIAAANPDLVEKINLIAGFDVITTLNSVASYTASNTARKPDPPPETHPDLFGTYTAYDGGNNYVTTVSQDSNHGLSYLLYMNGRFSANQSGSFTSLNTISGWSNAYTGTVHSNSTKVLNVYWVNSTTRAYQST